ncbi:imelysin family protein [Saccharospirillum salsuginis]|uniref:Imelysin-like domain-containing protein n=1 Tax=Saccharospirillum salsuginis TaxID=418750 RepID=A0A918NCZ8_9GAMM|nr:hypothetical protein [Saccharospirillum salsuginis]GGX59081.1 hypothetical protein GCM10007392_28500 [Saccharospirillum salsuginis]
MKPLIPLVLGAVLAAGAQADLATDWARNQKTAVSKWQDRTTAFVAEMNRVCDARPEARIPAEHRRALLPAWYDLVEAWGVVASQEPAAIDELGFGYRVAFWPDSRGVVVRQMETHAVQRQTGQFESLQIAGHGIQGLDWMLSRSQPDCRLMRDWADHYPGYVDQIESAMPERMRLADQAVTLAANDLYAQASRLNQRLREVMNEPGGRYRPFMGDVSETGQSVRFIRAGLSDLGARLVLFSERLPDDRMRAPANEWRNTLVELADTLPDGWPEESDAAWDMIKRIRAANQGVETWLKNDVADAYSLLIGFNNQDGD